MHLTLHNSVSGLAPRNLSPSSPGRFEGNAVIALKQMTAFSSALVCPGTAAMGGDALQVTSALCSLTRAKQELTQ